MKRLLGILLLISIAATAHAQGAGVLDPSRVPGSGGWTGAGAGAIPARLTICATPSLSTGSGNAATNGSNIRAAIAACPSGQTVKLNAGTYYVDYIYWGGSTTTMVGGVTLRGAGANSTFLIFTVGAACAGGLGGGLDADVCIMGQDNNFAGNPHNTANWTSGYAKGSTSITLDNTTNLHVGSVIMLDQLDDTFTTGDLGNIFVCQTYGSNGSCSQQGGVGNGRPGSSGCTSGCRAQNQLVTVTSISGGTVGISPGMYAPNWRSGSSPGAWWANVKPTFGDGIESMSLDHSNTTATGAGVMYVNTAGSWVKDVRGVDTTGQIHKQIWIYQGNNDTVRDSYLYGSNGSSESYGVDSGASSGDNLVENNICQHISTCLITEGASGTVFSYNYSVDNYYQALGSCPQCQQQDQYHHSVGDNFQLFEGNEGIGRLDDDIHGTAFMNTSYRIFTNGRDPAITLGVAKSIYTSAHNIFAFTREDNIIGSVLGTSGYHNEYKHTPTGTNDGGDGNGNGTVILLGFSGNGGTLFDSCSGSGCTPFIIPTDPQVAATTMLWGNYDTVNAAVQWNCGEVPTGSPIYANPCPATHTLPASLYLAAKPPFWTSMPWPAVGPDVTGGNISGYGGFAYHNPAANCYLNVMGGLTNGSSGLLSFDAYAATGSGGCAYGTGGGGGSPAVSLSTMVLSLGPIAPNAMTTQSVTLTNTGSAGLVMTSTVVSGSALYTISSNTCTGTIAALATCTTVVQFAPTTFGLTSATLTYTNNASPTTQTVMLNGNAVVSPPGPPPAPILQ